MTVVANELKILYSDSLFEPGQEVDFEDSKRLKYKYLGAAAVFVSISGTAFVAGSVINSYI